MCSSDLHLLDEVAGAQEFGLTGAGRRAADVHAADGAWRTEDDGAAGGSAAIGPVTDADAADIGDRVAPGRAPVHHTCESPLQREALKLPIGWGRESPALFAGCERCQEWRRT